jgi:hypothetical protein
MIETAATMWICGADGQKCTTQPSNGSCWVESRGMDAIRLEAVSVAKAHKSPQYVRDVVQVKDV